MNTKLLYTLLVLLFFLIFAQLLKRQLKLYVKKREMDLNRRKLILNFVYLIFYILVSIILALIWGVQFEDAVLFLSSALAVLGVGFFAQWSILSNLTSSLILFFYYPLKIGDDIEVIDKDYNWKGKVIDITGFYIKILNTENEVLMIPNSLVLQKGIKM